MKLEELNTTDELLNFIEESKHNWEKIANCTGGLPDKSELKELKRLERQIAQATYKYNSLVLEDNLGINIASFMDRIYDNGELYNDAKNLAKYLLTIYNISPKNK